MKKHSAFSTHLAALACAAGLTISAFAQAPAPPTLDLQDLNRAIELMGMQKYKEAMPVLSGIPTKYPTSPVIPEAYLRLAYAHYFTGDYAKALELSSKAKTAKGAPAEVVERAELIQPQSLYARGLKANNEKKDTGRGDLIQAASEFLEFVKKFPQSQEVESANYGAARAYLDMEQFEKAVAPLRDNVTKFPTSPLVAETQLLLASVLRAQGITALEKATTDGETQAARVTVDESEQLYRKVAGLSADLAVANAARFNLGELLFAEASFIEPTDDAKKQAQKKAFDEALVVLRQVVGKDAVIDLQKRRIAYFNQVAEQARAKGDQNVWKGNQRLAEKAGEKLADIETGPDLVPQARMKAGQVFLSLEQYDEARVLLKHVGPAIEDADGKKLVSYLTTVSYAAQRVADKAEKGFEDFFKAYPKDPLAENLPLLVGNIFLDPDPKLNNADKALKYLNQSKTLYPQSKFTADAIASAAAALVQLQRYDEALKQLTDFLATNPRKDLAASAEFTKAIIYRDTNKPDDAVKTFTAVTEKYAGSPQAEQSAFWIGQVTLAYLNKPKDAEKSLKAFLAKFPNSELVPNATYFLAGAQSADGQVDAAIKTYGELADKFPQHETAPNSYFRRAKLHQEAGKLAEANAVLDQFMSKYPDDPQLYTAYDYKAQMQVVQKDVAGAVKTYRDFLSKKGSEPTASRAWLRIANHEREEAEKLGRYISLPPDKRTSWEAGMKAATEAGEAIVGKFAESAEVAQAVEGLIKVQEHFVINKLSDKAKFQSYFDGLAAKSPGSAKAKITFGVASFVAKKEPKEAFSMMDKNFDATLVYAPADLDRYIDGLVVNKRFDDAEKAVAKLEKDFPPPIGTAPEKASRAIAEAHSNVVFWRGKIAQLKGDAAGSDKFFAELAAKYAWSDKQMEAEYLKADNAAKAKKYDEALAALRKVASATAATQNLRARAMMLIGKISEDQQQWADAANTYIKLGDLYQAERDLAAAALLKGAIIIEKQSTGELPVVIPAKPAAKGAKKK